MKQTVEQKSEDLLLINKHKTKYKQCEIRETYKNCRSETVLLSFTEPNSNFKMIKDVNDAFK